MKFDETGEAMTDNEARALTYLFEVERLLIASNKEGRNTVMIRLLMRVIRTLEYRKEMMDEL